MKTSFKEFLATINYEDPSDYDFDSDECIDKNILEAIKNINKSSWCWTLWSCEGHIHSENEKSLPYFVFIVKKKHRSYLLQLLFDTLDPIISEKTMLPLCNTHSLSVSWGYTDDKYAILNAHWMEDFLEEDKHQKLLKDIYDMSFKVLEAGL